MMLAADGELHSTIACARCVNRGVMLVTRPSTDPLGIKAEGLDAEEKDVRAVLRKLANHLRGIAKAKRANFERTTQISARGKFDDFDTCADVAEAWAVRPGVRK